MTGQENRAWAARYYLGPGRTRRITPGRTASVDRHFARTIEPLALAPGARVLELGCGLGRFTELLLDRGLDVTALDLSEDLIADLRARVQHPRLHAVAGAAEDLAHLVSGRFDAVVGFFVLHHFEDLPRALAIVAGVLKPGGQLAFCEPNAFNPLVYLQITFTPGMSWRGEPNVPAMRPSVIFPILEPLGFTDCRTELYGVFPPVVANTPLGARCEQVWDGLPFRARALSAYRTFTARLT